MSYLSEAQMRKAMHAYGLTKRGAPRKPKTQRRKYAGAGRAPTPATVQAIRKVSGEKKGVDTSLVITTVLDTATTNVGIIPVNLVAAGAGSFNRVGRKIFNKSLRVIATARFQSAPVATTVNFEAYTLRMVVVWDKQPSGAIPVWSDIFKVTDQGGTEVASLMGPPAFDNMNRFQVLRDVKINPVISAVAAGGTENRIQYVYSIDEYIKLGNRQTIYSGDTATMTISDVSSGALYVGFRAQGAPATVAVWSIRDGSSGTLNDSIARLRYSD